MQLAPEVLRLAERTSEVTLITYGRTTGKPVRIVIWFCPPTPGEQATFELIAAD